MEPIQGNVSIDAQNIMPIIKKWLYSDKDIFIREVVSNGCDAITKLRMVDSAAAQGCSIHVEVDKAARELRFIDDGVGMTEDEVKTNINQVAFSGAKSFMEEYAKNEDKENSGIIGHFGLGFYSVFMIADKVTIDTLSFREGATPVRWESEDGMAFTMTEGTRTARGTTIILHVSEAESEFLEVWRVREVLDRYCSFMSVPIYLDEIKEEEAKVTGEGAEEKPEAEKEAPKPINDTQPLYARAPQDCTDEDYKQFYRKVFHDYRDPLFWIHINADYPLNFKGILYFPRLDNEYESIEGQVKLYYNQVFVADNIKEVIPEYLLMLKGVLDCPELPLNVSRSYLQNNTYVSKVSAHIVKKVCDKLNSLCNTDRENYESVWDSIKTFVEYACMRDRKFYDRAKDAILLTLTDGSHVTVERYAEKAKADGHVAPAEEGKDPVVTVYYTTDRELQAQYIALFEAQGIQIAVLDKLIDTQFVQMLESYDATVKFQRIDADPAAALKADGDVTENQTLVELFRKASGNDKLEVRFEALKDASLPAMLTVSEQSRRMEEMMKLYAMQTGGKEQAPLFPLEYTLLLNTASPLISKLTALVAEGAPEDASGKAELIAEQIWRLSVLAQRKFTADELKNFLAGSFDILTKL